MIKIYNTDVDTNKFEEIKDGLCMNMEMPELFDK